MRWASENLLIERPMGYPPVGKITERRKFLVLLVVGFVDSLIVMAGYAGSHLSVTC